jgi:hypothetical protein
MNRVIPAAVHGEDMVMPEKRAQRWRKMDPADEHQCKKRRQGICEEQG